MIEFDLAIFKRLIVPVHIRTVLGWSMRRSIMSRGDGRAAVMRSCTMMPSRPGMADRWSRAGI